MADLNKYPVPLYGALHPYHWEYDNLPLEALKLRDEAINGQLENISDNIRDASGTQGTLSNRLNQSIDEDGNIKTTAVDQTLHNIAEHADGSKVLTQDEIDAFVAIGYAVSNPVPFVRMLSAERDKLALIANNATSLSLGVDVISNIIEFEDGLVTLANSASVSWEVLETNKIKANLAFPVAAAHRHYYDLEPVTEDNLNYGVTSVNTPYVENSLRVYINGVRLSKNSDVYTPNYDATSWNANSYTENAEEGTFILASEVNSLDVIRVDFDISFI